MCLSTADARSRCEPQQAVNILLAAVLAVMVALSLPGCTTSMSRASAAPASVPPAQPRAAEIGNAFAQLNALQREASALPDPLAVHAFYLEHWQHSSGVLHEFLAQVLAATDAEMGAYEKAVLQFPSSAPRLRNTPAALADPADFHAVNAAEAIAELAGERRIVMLNEAHHVAQTRLLTLALLPRLRELGFTHFAAEDLDERDVDLAARSYPVVASGTYVHEPLYGEIIRTALRLGFIVVPYDSTHGESDPVVREEEQARHLVERVFRAAPNARLLVHAGYAHVHKRADYFYTATLAMRLRRMTGFDPLSIDQTLLRPIEPGREYADYRELLRRFPITEASVLLRDAAPRAWSLEPQVYDVSVLLPPPTREIAGRPDWLDLGGERMPVLIDLDLSSTQLPCLIEARYAAEDTAAIPADRLLLEHAGDKPALFLRRGNYRLDTLCSAGQGVAGRALHVGG